MAETNEQKGDILLQWTFLDRIQHDRSRAWYIWFLVAIIGSVAIGLFAHNYTFIALTIVAAAVIILLLRRPPAPVPFAIREEGIEVGSVFYPWRRFSEFWILYQPPTIKKLYLHPKGLQPAMDIPIDDQNPVMIRQLLSEKLPENSEREEEPTIDRLSRALKL